MPRSAPTTAFRRHLVQLLLVLVAFAATIAPTDAAPQVDLVRFNCSSEESCIDRPSYYIKAIVHGTSDSLYWREIQASMIQTAMDLKVDLEVDLYDGGYDPQRMADDIRRAAYHPDAANFRPDALIVSVPDAAVQDAIGEVIERTSIPVFGINAGGEVMRQLGIKGYVGVDEYVAGATAGDHVKSLLGRTIQDGNPKQKGLYINHEFGNLALEERFLGLQDALPDTDFDKLNFFPDDDTGTPLMEAFDGCPYRIVVLAGSKLLDPVLDAMRKHGCQDSDLDSTFVGAYDTDTQIYEAISSRELDFTISQQLSLQGAVSVVMATLYITTGKKLAESSSSYFGIYQSGPKLVTPSLIASHELQVCEFRGFPVCTDGDAPALDDDNDALASGASANGTGLVPTAKTATSDSSAACACTQRRNIRLAGITHGDKTSGFWDEVYAAMEQAGRDFGVSLQLPRLEKHPNDQLLHEKMASQIRHYCDEQFDGIFTSIPSDIVVEAIQYCQGLGVPIVSINSGVDKSEELGLMNHVGQIELQAGRSAGRYLLNQGVKRGLCFFQEENNVGLFERCDGMREVFEEEAASGTGVEFVGAMFLSPTSTTFKETIEEMVGVDGSWDGIGLLAGGQSILHHLIEVQAHHPDVKIGSFDTSDKLYETLKDQRVLFGVDQNSYLQGYLPVALLTWRVSTNQALFDRVAETGPDLVTAPPTAEEQQCQSVLYKACSETTGPTRNRTVDVSLSKSSAVASSTIASIVAASSAVFLLVIV